MRASELQPFDVVVVDGIVVVHADGAAVEFFVESGSAKLVELTQSGADGPARDIKSGEYIARSATGALTSSQRPPKAFVDALPRHFVDPLPTLAARIKAKPALVVDHEITYAEAEPWLAGRDRAAFEKRFASRLRDPAFRAAVAAEHRPLPDVGSDAQPGEIRAEGRAGKMRRSRRR